MRPVYGRVPKRAGVCYFFPRPSAGSACKRLNLFLRWMVRSDEVDLGVWRSLRPGQLIVPLDTHIIRLARCLRLTRYTSPGWKMAADITARLRALDPHDPVRFDFSICHVGMMNACGFGRGQGDSQCPLKGHCHPRVSALGCATGQMPKLRKSQASERDSPDVQHPKPRDLQHRSRNRGLDSRQLESAESLGGRDVAVGSYADLELRDLESC